MLRKACSMERHSQRGIPGFSLLTDVALPLQCCALTAKREKREAISSSAVTFKEALTASSSMCLASHVLHERAEGFH